MLLIALFLAQSCVYVCFRLGSVGIGWAIVLFVSGLWVLVSVHCSGVHGVWGYLLVAKSSLIPGEGVMIRD